MHTIGTIILLFGILFMAAAQLYVTAMTFKVTPLRGILCFVIPGYAFFVAKRHGFYGKFFATYIIGIFGMIVGGSLLS